MDKDRYIAQGIATAPITTSALRQLLKRSHVDTDEVVTDYAPVTVKGLCTHPNINKWAKYKPIKHHTIGNITEEQRKDRKGNGELYGVIVTGGNELAKLHDVAFTYIRPEGGEKSPYRLGDFLGYDHKAKPSVSGEMQWGGKGSGYISTDGYDNISVHIDVNAVSNGSIRLEEFLPSDIAGNSITDFYPVVIVGSWAVVMRHKDGFGNHNIRRLKENLISYSDFVADLNSYLPDDTSGFPRKSGTVLPLSFGLIKEYKEEGVFDLTKWTSVDNGYITTLPALGIPALDDSGLCGMQATLYSEYDKYKVAIGIMPPDSKGFGITVLPAIKDEFVGITDATLNVRFGQNNTFAPIVSRTISVEKDATQVTFQAYEWLSDFGLVSAPTGEYEIYATVVYQGHVVGSTYYYGN